MFLYLKQLGIDNNLTGSAIRQPTPSWRRKMSPFTAGVLKLLMSFAPIREFYAIKAPQTNPSFIGLKT